MNSSRRESLTKGGDASGIPPFCYLAPAAILNGGFFECSGLQFEKLLDAHFR